jgi:hypothetical protein
MLISTSLIPDKSTITLINPRKADKFSFIFIKQHVIIKLNEIKVNLNF